MRVSRCSVSCQRAKPAAQSLASARETKGREGYSCRYFKVRKSASEYGLPSLARGQLDEATAPRFWRVASMVEPFIGPPLPAYGTMPLGSRW